MRLVPMIDFSIATATLLTLAEGTVRDVSRTSAWSDRCVPAWPDVMGAGH